VHYMHKMMLINYIFEEDNIYSYDTYVNSNFMLKAYLSQWALLVHMQVQLYSWYMCQSGLTTKLDRFITGNLQTF
jgi:hypothetical protein